MSMIVQLIVYILVGLAVFILYYFYQFYIKPRQLMKYYQKQGVNHQYYKFIVGKYDYYKTSVQDYGDCMYIAKNFLKENPDCRFFMTNLASHVCITLYDPLLIKQFYSSNDLIKHQFGVELYRDLLDGFVFNEGQVHARKRKIVSQVFHYQLLVNMVPQLSDILDEYIQKISDSKVDDFLLMSQDIAAEAVMVLFFGNSLKNQKYNGKTIPDNISCILDSLGTLSRSPLYAFFGKTSVKFGKMAKLQKDIKGLKGYFKEILMKRINLVNLDDLKHKQRKDLVDFLVENNLISKSQTENSLTIEEVIEEFITFYVAGMDTTGHTFGMICYFLCIYPECKKLLCQEIEKFIKTPADLNADNIKNMKYLQAFVQETLRYYTVADQLFVRKATKDIQIGELKILKGTMVNIGNIENHFNPKYFKEPNTFNPNRWLDGSTDKLDPFVFNPFSSGKNNCIGQHFAQLEIKICIIKFLQKLDLEVDPNYKLSLEYKFLIHPKEPIPITFKSIKK